MSADPSNTPKLSVVIPLYNEEDNVALLQGEVDKALADVDYELVLVDDGSSDNTVGAVIRNPHVRLLEFEKNTGQSAAMFAGINAATGEIVATLDGDLQNDPADIPKLLEHMEKEGLDLVCGLGCVEFIHSA